MTIIAWDGKTLAADKSSWAGGARSNVKKIFRVEITQGDVKRGVALAAVAGYTAYALAVLRYLEGNIPAMPQPYKDMENEDIILLIYPCGAIHRVTTQGISYPILEKFAAFGAYQLATRCLLYLGVPAKRALEVVLHNSDMGISSIDTLEF